MKTTTVTPDVSVYVNDPGILFCPAARVIVWLLKVEVSINLLNVIAIPPGRLTGTFISPLEGLVELTVGGAVSGGGTGPLRPHAVINNTEKIPNANRTNSFFIPFTP